jgi:cob(I)alamin adenosyltransferase
MPYYTGKGDAGRTGLLGACNCNKNDPIFAAIGDIDELNSAVGTALYYTHDDMVRGELKMVQNDLFVIGASLASIKGVPKKTKLEDDAVGRLEKAIGDIGRRIPAPKKFVIPGGCEGAVHLHIARAVARRAERSAVAVPAKYKVCPEVKEYLNRLSSYLFAAAIYLNYTEEIDESHPTY